MLRQLSEDLLAGADQASEFTGLSRRTIYHLVEKEEIPFRRIRGRLYFRKTALDICFGGASTEDLISDNQNDKATNA